MRESWKPSAPFITSCALVGILAALSVLLPERSEAVPARRHFAEMQTHIGDWLGRKVAMEHVYLDTLKLDDYQLADYSRGSEQINLYVAWYDSQRGGQSTHSPRTCLPGGGWQIADLKETPISGVTWGTTPLVVNRALIQTGQQRQLVYYWFQQRGRVVTNEYAVKWYMFWDALTRKRTDGALIRVITPLKPGELVEAGDRRLTEFVAEAVPQLKAYVPD
jgi:EpsI family protein